MILRLTSRLITTHHFLKISSAAMGFFMWYILSDFRAITATFPLTIYFDNRQPEQQITAPETVEITLSGTRNYIHTSRAQGALHFDVRSLKSGTQLVYPCRENLLLPSAVKVLNYNPIEITLTSL